VTHFLTLDDWDSDDVPQPDPGSPAWRQEREGTWRCCCVPPGCGYESFSGFDPDCVFHGRRGLVWREP
jgi:hypothetical protein